MYISYYLMLHRDSEILQQVLLVLGFLLHTVYFSSIKHLSNFNMSDILGAYALTVNLATDIFFHRACRGCLH